MAQVQSTDREPTTNGLKPKRNVAKQYASLQDDAGELGQLDFSAEVEPIALDWHELPVFALFTTNPTSKLLKVKNSKSSYIDLKTNQHKRNIISGRCYRVHI